MDGEEYSTDCKTQTQDGCEGLESTQRIQDDVQATDLNDEQIGRGAPYNAGP